MPWSYLVAHSNINKLRFAVMVKTAIRRNNIWTCGVCVTATNDYSQSDVVQFIHSKLWLLPWSPFTFLFFGQLLRNAMYAAMPMGSGVWIGPRTGVHDRLDPSRPQTTGPTASRTHVLSDAEVDADAQAPNAMDCVILGKTGVYSRAIYTDILHLVRSYEKVSNN